MKVVVLVKQVPDTYEKRDIALDTGMLVRDGVENVVDEIDERVCAVAAELKKAGTATEVVAVTMGSAEDRKSTRLNSSHVAISYAVFCLEKKKDSRWTRGAR